MNSVPVAVDLVVAAVKSAFVIYNIRERYSDLCVIIDPLFPRLIYIYKGLYMCRVQGHRWEIRFSERQAIRVQYLTLPFLNI